MHGAEAESWAGMRKPVARSTEILTLAVPRERSRARVVRVIQLAESWHTPTSAWPVQAGMHGQREGAAIKNVHKQGPVHPKPTHTGQSGQDSIFPSHHRIFSAEAKLVPGFQALPTTSCCSARAHGHREAWGHRSQHGAARSSSQGCKLLSGSMCRCAALVYRPTFFSITAQDRAHCR